MEKEEATRVEKHAQAHLDKAQSISASATKIALAWVVALLLLWTQKLEPNLSDIQSARNAKGSIVTAQEHGTPFTTLLSRYKENVQSAKRDDIELPFSIKFKLPPQWTPTLWLFLALVLVVYLLWARLQILFLAKRGSELFGEAGSEPPYIKAIIGGIAWWVAPLPSKAKNEQIDTELRQSLGMDARRLRLAKTLVVVSALALIIVELRVFYVGLSVTAFLLVTHPDGSSNKLSWWGLTLLNAALCFGLFLAATAWFTRAPRSSNATQQSLRSVSRRDAIRFAAIGATALVSYVFALGASTYGFGSRNFSTKRQGVNPNFKPPNYGPKRTRAKKRTTLGPSLPDGLYQNQKTGSIHTASALCKTCLVGCRADSLRLIEASKIEWITQKIDRAKKSTHHTETSSLQIPNSGHLHRRHRAFILEGYALELVSQGNSARACEFLWAVLEKDPDGFNKSNMRLYDLMAGLAVRAQRSQLLQLLISRLGSMVEINDRRINFPISATIIKLLDRFTDRLLELAGSQPSYWHSTRHRRHHRELRPKEIKSQLHQEYLALLVHKRTKKWSNANSTWHKKWLDKSRPVKWDKMAII